MPLEYGSIPPPTIVNYELPDDNGNDELSPHTASGQSSGRRWIAVACFIGMLLFVSYASSSNGTTSIEILGKTNASHKKKSKHLKDTVRKEKKVFKPLYFKDQLVDHFSNKEITKRWNHRYYESDDYFGGPGHPIFVIIGGEDELTGLLYPFVYEHLAKEFKAFVFAPEHRFYGESQPIRIKRNSDFVGLHTVEQSMADTLRLLSHKRKELDCSMHRSSKNYCPVITVGGSYPGFLSFLFRFLHADVVDMAYASSAPLPLYTQAVDSRVYYDKITDVAENASPGCHDAIKSTLTEFGNMVENSALNVAETADGFHVCVDSIPNYIHDNIILRQELLMIIDESFADFNMGYYPPSGTSQLVQACHLFQEDVLSVAEKIKGFWKLLQLADDLTSRHNHCFDLTSNLPSGPNATLTTADWSGAGGSETGRSWEFQTCYDLVIRTGFSEESMFPKRTWSEEWLAAHCESRFGQPIDPTRLVRTYGFDDLVARNASKVLFTNGLNDGWSVVSITTSPHPLLPVVNFPNGAHHSDLSHAGPSENDTDDIKEGFIVTKNILAEWLNDVMYQKEAM